MSCLGHSVSRYSITGLPGLGTSRTNRRIPDRFHPRLPCGRSRLRTPFCIYPYRGACISDRGHICLWCSMADGLARAGFSPRGCCWSTPLCSRRYCQGISCVRDRKKTSMITIENLRFNAIRIRSLSIRPGITSVIGPNGSGKTSLLKLLAGIVSTRFGEHPYKRQNATQNRDGMDQRISGPEYPV